MDPLTHYMFAYMPGRKINLKKPQLKALTFSAMLPDIDVFTVVLGWNFFVDFHGTITHSIAVAVLLALILSLVFFLYYREQVVLYSLIGVGMHLLLDFLQTSMPEWREKDMLLLYPFSTEQFSSRYMIPYSLLIGSVMISLLIFFTMYLLVMYMKQKEYPWRIWLDDRKIIKALRITSTK